MTPPIDPARLDRWLDERREELIAVLTELARIESPSRDPATLAGVFRRVQEHLAESGYLARVEPGARSGGQLLAWARDRDPARPTQLLLGHCDTVWPVGTVQQMPVTREGGILRGPGVYDMKAGVVQALYAVRALAALGVPRQVEPVLLFTSDEEVGSGDSRALVEELAHGADRVLVMEPSLGRDGRLKTARKGVGRFTVTVRGRAAHAGLDPGAGVSAILELSHVIQQLFALNDPAAGITVNVGTVDGGLQANVVAPESRAVVDVRVPSVEDAARVEAAIRGLRPTTPGAELEIEGTMGRPPMERTPRNQALWRLARALGRSHGLELEEAAAGGGSDGNYTSLHAATLDGLGAVGDGAHAAHEQVVEASLLSRTALLAQLVAAPPLAVVAPPLAVVAPPPVELAPPPAERAPPRAEGG